jgi:hypothetical protein
MDKQILQEFEKRFPPQYTGYYKVNPGQQVALFKDANGVQSFTFKANKYQGGFVGEVNLGEVEVKGQIQPSGEIIFHQPA